MIITVGSQKGGTGKSTLATSIAVELAKTGDTLLFDGDPQRSAAQWAADRADEQIEPRITCVQGLEKSLRADVMDLSKRYDHIVIDTAGRDSIAQRYALTVSDWFISPMRPSQMDLDTAPALSDVISEARGFNSDLRVAVVLNQCSTHPNDKTKDGAREVLSHYPDLPVLNTSIHLRLAFSEARALGLGITEHTDAKAKAEMVLMLEEVGL